MTFTAACLNIQDHPAFQYVSSALTANLTAILLRTAHESRYTPLRIEIEISMSFPPVKVAMKDWCHLCFAFRAKSRENIHLKVAFSEVTH